MARRGSFVEPAPAFRLTTKQLEDLDGMLKTFDNGTVIKRMDGTNWGTVTEVNGVKIIKMTDEASRTHKSFSDKFDEWGERNPKLAERLKNTPITLLKLGVIGGAIGLYYDALKDDEKKREFACNTFCMPKSPDNTPWDKNDQYRKDELKAHGLRDSPICDPNAIKDQSCEDYCKKSCDEGLRPFGPVGQGLKDLFPFELPEFFYSFGEWIIGIICCLCCVCVIFMVYKNQ